MHGTRPYINYAGAALLKIGGFSTYCDHFMSVDSSTRPGVYFKSWKFTWSDVGWDTQCGHHPKMPKICTGYTYRVYLPGVPTGCTYRVYLPGIPTGCTYPRKRRGCLSKRRACPSFLYGIWEPPPSTTVAVARELWQSTLWIHQANA